MNYRPAVAAEWAAATACGDVLTRLGIGGVISLFFAIDSANGMLPVPAMKQRNTYQDVLSGVYYHASRSIWALSSRQIMLGPDFLVLASAEEAPGAPLLQFR